ncbi:MAG: hypothetical protein P0Y53_18790 [Candidatus Pseudobacter hemicellulosilyticus]|uniref:Alpha-L-rhamnosidase six-hairpin glycosidase domain-containing protein n=1 Tax=Candidatus Pseudobacter hemicellulosilyticus TaxID=3121375 RepID=A0AAJ5WQ53_9BACT|nr:MAG: hypothetical protein P0Y53_18790 [Pseudobacter sp.]
MDRISIIGLIGMLLFWPFLTRGQDPHTLYYEGRAATALVGDGKFIVKTAPEHFRAAKGIALEGRLRFERNGESLLPAPTFWNTSMIPGGVTYSIRIGRDSLEVSYGVLPATGFAIAIRTPAGVQTRLDLDQSIPLHRTEARLGKQQTVLYTQQPVSEGFSYQTFHQQLQAASRQPLVLRSPDTTLNKAVAFSQSLLDLSYNGELMFCELFRWLDIWARDLGSGLLPGALVSGRPVMARQSLVYDLNRYALMRPEDCKNSNDPSQGGTASEVGWTVRSLWLYYYYSGNLDTLRKDYAVMRPWVEFWINRDYDEDGLITDVTDFMDHMLMMCSTNGVRTLASNAMYASLLQFAAKVEAQLGNRKAADRLQRLYRKTVDAVNTVYWNADKGYFSNMTLWDSIDHRSSQASQAMLLKIGATDEQRTRRTLDYLQQENWTKYGSVTITPRMNHVDMQNDQNVKVWPWWNLWEAEARFGHQDAAGGYQLLQLAAATIEDEKYPGFIEETLDTNGVSIGGNVFVTAAGNLLDVVVKDLLGIEVMQPGWKTVKITPAVPAQWTNYSCTVPTPNGTISLQYQNNQLIIDVTDPSIQELLVLDPAATRVTGATARKWSKPAPTAETNYQPVPKKTIKPFTAGKTAIFYDPAFHQQSSGLHLPALNLEGLGKLANSGYRTVVITGNQLPLYTPSGKPVKTAIEDFVRKGGTLVFYGASTNAKSEEDGAGILGEQGGLVDWYQYLPAREKIFLTNWTFTPDPRNLSAAEANGQYKSTVVLPAAYAGQAIYLELGPLVGQDSVFINGLPVAAYADMEPLIQQQYPTRTNYYDTHRYKMLSRYYVLQPGSKAYAALRFGQSNSITVRIVRDGMGWGLPESNQPNIGIMTSRQQWQALDEALPGIGLSHPKRKGVNYWGSEQFFNAWSTKNGLFGFSIQGQGIQFPEGTALSGLATNKTAPELPIQTAYTDFALFRPWTFEALAYTTTHENLLYPATTERYPCIARIVNTDTQGGYLLIAPAIAQSPLGKQVLQQLNIRL